MKTNRIGGAKGEKGREVDYRKLAEHHAIGLDTEIPAEKRRIFNLVLNEAEALACATGVPELVMLTLAEEKVRSARQWFVRQEAMKRRNYEWQIAA